MKYITCRLHYFHEMNLPKKVNIPFHLHLNYLIMLLQHLISKMLMNKAINLKQKYGMKFV